MTHLNSDPTAKSKTGRDVLSCLNFSILCLKPPAKDAHVFHRELAKAGIEDADALIQELTGEAATRAGLEAAIQNRLETGFKNWNGGYDGWLEWCNTLYEPDAYYNVYGHRLTLQQYKDMMGQLFQHYTMELGTFDNMIIKDNWAAIRYTVKVKNLGTGEEELQHTMEFVQFKDNGGDIGVRVVEGWALSDSPLSAKG